MTVEKQREVIRLWNELRKLEGPAAEELRIQILECFSERSRAKRRLDLRPRTPRTSGTRQARPQSDRSRLIGRLSQPQRGEHFEGRLGGRRCGASIRRWRFRNEDVPSAFGLHDMPAMRQADDGDFRPQLSMRTLPRDRHRVRGRLEIPAAEDCAECRRSRDRAARFHRSLGIDSR